MNQSNKIPLTQQESEELAREIQIERERKEHYKKQLEMLKNKKKLIGKEATVKYFNLTPDGIPRFPYVINVDRFSYE